MNEKILIICWNSYVNILREAARITNTNVKVLSYHALEVDPSGSDTVERHLKESNMVLIYKSNQNQWEDIDTIVRTNSGGRYVMSFGSDPMFFSLTNTDHSDTVTVYSYFISSGIRNMVNMFRFLKNRYFGSPEIAEPPTDPPWQGIVHPNSEKVFGTLDEYLGWYRSRPGCPWVGVIMSRTMWITGGCDNVDYKVITDLEEEGLNVIPMFTMSERREENGQISLIDSVQRFFLKDGRPFVTAAVKLTTSPIGSNGGDADVMPEGAAKVLTDMNIPFIQPIIASKMSKRTWEESPGLVYDLTWMVAMPEYEGMIEPLMLGFTRPDDETDSDRVIIPESSRLLAKRVKNRALLGSKPVSERKAIFFLNNNPCASVEANVGAASHLDTMESLTNIMKRMKVAGYDVEPPDSGKELITAIMDRKAISEFRWTTAQEIDRRGGVIYRMPVEEYLEFFNGLSQPVKRKMIETWGEPPGQSMVLDGKILITGVIFGNVAIAVQPKRGCYGSRCDGQVCKILHDPLCPPTHQYLATYYYYEKIWGADVVVHTGTHGSLEFLPGKTGGISVDSYPVIGIGDAPHLYIYNADNPPEGITAKRRSLATIIDHMQCVMTPSELYEELAKLDDLLAQSQNAVSDPSHEHQLRHLIMEQAERANLRELGLDHDTSLSDMVSKCHEALSRIRNSQMNLGMHVIGRNPEGERRTEFINMIMRYDCGNGSVRDTVGDIMGADLDSLYKDQGGYSEEFDMSNGALIELVTGMARKMISLFLEGRTAKGALDELGLSSDDDSVSRMEIHRSEVLDISSRIDASDEIGNLLNGMNGGFVRPGPSGDMTRGRPDILPTGRNFYALNPDTMPTETAFRTGTILAEQTIRRYCEDTGEMPETVGIYWMCSDILMADGEVLGQIMSLMGIRPVYETSGMVNRYSIIPLDELKHPRIDITARISGILRDNFMSRVDLLDRAIKEIVELDEPSEMNFIRKHYLESIAEGANEEEASARFFSAPPGAYSSGVKLAVFASAWKTEKDLSDVYIAANGYAYGGKRKGEAMHAQFASNLSKVSVTYNKIASDEHDLLGCCCYFSNQGGMTASAKQLSGKDVKAYYGDTREPKDINVHTLADEIRRTVRTKLLNPAWIEGEKEHGYKGCSDIMKRISRVYGFEASTQMVDDWIFDDITNKFVNDPEMRKFFQENNPYALEEIARRMLEANQRELWDADPETLERLKENYVEIESWMEDLAGDGDYQGGNIDIMTSVEVEGWSDNLSEIMKKVHSRMDHKK